MANVRRCSTFGRSLEKPDKRNSRMPILEFYLVDVDFLSLERSAAGALNAS
jgi:hypothetical protein